ncbi:hypothetical protein H0248_07050 [Pectobacterium brasiliense]|nr:hypothetical protein [Pectobacterium brasiliense]
MFLLGFYLPAHILDSSMFPTEGRIDAENVVGLLLIFYRDAQQIAVINKSSSSINCYQLQGCVVWRADELLPKRM